MRDAMSRTTQRTTCTAVALWIAFASVRPLDVAAAADAARADELKAAYLFNFAKLVEWPPSTPADSLTICFIGANGVHEAFARAARDKQVGARRVLVKHL